MAKAGRRITMEQASTVIDKLFEEVDSEVALAGVMGALAAYGGITPPLTRLLASFSSEDVKTDVVDAAKFVSPLIFLGDSIGDWLAPKNMESSTTADKAEQYRRTVGLMASGAFEGMLMMELVKNKELMARLMKMGTDLGSATIQAAGDAVPF